MRINLHLKKILLLLIVNLAFISFVSAQVSWYESFDYSDPLYIGGNGAAGTSSNNWTTHSVTSGQTTTIDVVTDNLSYTGLPDPVGKKILLFSNANATSRDINRAITDGATTMYYSALINVVDNSQLSSTGFDYFMAFGATSGTTLTVLGARLGIMSVNSAANYRLGICNTSGTGTNYTEFAQDLNFGTTYLIVVKYDISASPTVATIWVNPASLGATEPATGSVSNTSSASTFAAINSLALRNTATTPKVYIDEIRVGKTYADVAPAGGPDVTAPVATIVPADATTDVAINTVPTITFDEAIKKTDGTEVTDADLTTLVKFKKTNSTGADVACTMTIDATKKVITITPTAALDNSQAYYIECGEVEDAAGNTGVVTSATFTTISATTPTLTITAPVTGASYYAGDNVTITWTSTNITNVAIDVYESGTLVTNLTTSTAAAAGSFATTIPADAGYSAAYTIRISDASNANFFVDSNPFTIVGVATSISDLRSRFAATDVVKLSSEAIITFIQGKNYYAQDAGAGILIYDTNTKLTTAYAQYDGIKGVTGTLSDYNGVLELIPITDAGAAFSTGNTVVPVEVNAVSLNSDINTYESRLVKILGMTFADAGGTFEKPKNYNISDGTTTTVFRTAFTSDITGTTIPGKADIIGLAMEYKGAAQIASRSLADLTIYSSAKAITAFAFNALSPVVNGTIDEGLKTIAATVPAGTDLTTLVPSITVSAKATVSPESGTTVNFTNPVVFTVTAEDGTKQTYTVTVSLGTGIGDDPQANMKMYPVPATTTLYLKNIESVKFLEVFNAAGVKIETVRTEGLSFYDLPVSSYKPGLYFIRFTSDSGVFMKKFMKR